MASQLSPLAGALLGLLHEQPMSGYDLRKLFAATPLRHFSDSPGAIYPALRRLQSSRLISGAIDRSTRLRPRQVFSLTPAGRSSLEKHLAATPSREEVRDHLDLLFLRFVFMPAVLGPRRTIRFLEALALEIAEYRTELEDFYRQHGPNMDLAGRLTLRHGIDTFALHQRWCRRSLATLRRMEKKS